MNPGAAPDRVANPGMPNNPNLVGQPGQPSQGSIKLPGSSAVPDNAAPVISKPVAPAPTTSTAQPTTEQNPVQFNSAHIGSKTAQKQDPFAEQNQKAAVEKQKQTKTRNCGLIIGGIALAVVVIITVAIFFVIKTNSTPNQEDNKVADNVFDKAITSVNQAISAANGAGNTSVNTTNEATTIFENAIQEATDANDHVLADTLKVSQMRLYINTGNNNEKIIEIGESIDNPQNLDIATRAELYNFMALAYSAIGNNDKAAEYYRLSAELSTEIENYGE